MVSTDLPAISIDDLVILTSLQMYRCVTLREEEVYGECELYLIE